METVADGFFAVSIPNEAVMMEAAGKKVLINQNIQRLNYRVQMTGGTLASTLPAVSLESVSLPDVTLPDATLESTMPSVTIEEL